MCALPEFGPDATVPGSIAMAMHFVDYVVHGWDVAAALASPFQLPDEVLAAALPIVLGIPDDGSREAANAPFGHAVEATGTTDLDTATGAPGQAAGLVGSGELDGHRSVIGPAQRIQFGPLHPRRHRPGGQAGLARW